MTNSSDLWFDSRVLLTGHTGFKGSWMALLLEKLGAQITGLSLAPETPFSLYESLQPWQNLTSVLCDIRDFKNLKDAIIKADPEIVIHMAAQALVRESYQNPLETMHTNVMGTVHLLESLRYAPNLKAVLVITSDKVYLNNNKTILSESHPLGGHDPYSASKAATEIVTDAYCKSFFVARNIPVCTARAGNVIGGGDFAKDRIIPDLWRAFSEKNPVSLRYPSAIRPWQHVLDPIYGYLLYIEQMIDKKPELPRALNFGPPSSPVRTVLEVAESFMDTMGAKNLFTVGVPDPLMQESQFLSIDPSLAKKSLGWNSILDVNTAIGWTSLWYKAFQNGQDMRQFSNYQLDEYIKLFKNLPIEEKALHEIA